MPPPMRMRKTITGMAMAATIMPRMITVMTMSTVITNMMTTITTTSIAATITNTITPMLMTTSEPAPADEHGVTLALPVAPGLVHAGGVLCGQAIMSASDTAMLVAMIARLGAFRPMTTVQLQTSFLRPVPQDVPAVMVEARVLRFGKTLSYGEVSFRTPDERLAAHATATYSML